MIRATISTWMLAAAIGGSAVAQVGGGFDQSRGAIAGGAVEAAGGGFSVVGSAAFPGQAGPVLSGGYEVSGGYEAALCHGGLVAYGSGCPGAGGFVPQFTYVGCPAGGEDIALQVTNGLGGSVAILFLGLGEAALPMGAGCTLNVFPLLPISIGPLPLSAGGPGQGAITVPVKIPADAPFGFAITVQAFVTDAASPTGFGNSAGVKVVHG